MIKYRKKKYFYLVLVSQMNYQKLEFSYWDLNTPNERPKFDWLVKYENTLDKYKHKETQEVFYLLPFSYNFSTPMAGYDFYTHSTLEDKLSEFEIQHNEVNK